jgi:signal transduction histidine kinase
LATVGLAYAAQATAKRRWPDPRPAVRWGVGVGMTVLLTLAALAAALYARHYWRYEPLPVRELARFRVYPHFVGFSAQLFIVPTALIYLFSRTPIFRRIVGGGATTRDVLKLFGALVLLQLVSLNYELGLFIQSPDYVTLGLLITIVAGLLGGWQVGLGVGVVAFLVSGTRLSIVRLDMGEFLRVVWREGGMWRLFDWALWRVFRDCYLTNPWALSPIWAGTVAGVWAGLLGKRRFTPLAAFTLGIALNLGAGYIVAIADEVTPFWIESLPSSTLTVGVAMAAVALMVRSVQMEAARREAAAAELARTRAELRALRAQINPHFLFNAINTIRYFVRTDPEAARRLLLNLSEVFQRTLRSGEFVPLRDELGYVEAYLALEKARLGERLHIVRGAWAEEWLDYQVPTLILQPIVENAVAHGIAGKPEGGTVCITITQVDDALVLQVADDGSGIPPAKLAEIRGSTGSSGGGIGLRNVDLRLRTLYGEDYRLTVESEVERGTCVTIRIPIEEEE